jgi:hypothetical protein
LNRGLSLDAGGVFHSAFFALLISSAEAMESMTPIPIIPNALPTAEVSAFSIAEVLLM